jgi:hypothetical protein
VSNNDRKQILQIDFPGYKSKCTAALQTAAIQYLLPFKWVMALVMKRDRLS